MTFLYTELLLRSRTIVQADVVLPAFRLEEGVLEILAYPKQMILIAPLVNSRFSLNGMLRS